MRVYWEHYPKLDKRLLELEAENYTTTSIAKILTDEYIEDGLRFTEDQVRNRLKRIPRNRLEDKPITEPMPYFKKYQAVIEGIDIAPEKKPLPSLSKGKVKILDLGDTHVPFQDEEGIQYAVSTNLTSDLVVIGGDYGDLYAISRFDKEINMPLNSEIDGIVRLNEFFSEAFRDSTIIIINSNHHKRVGKAIQYPMGLEFLVQENMLEALACPFPNIITVEKWWVQLGDFISCHDERFLKKDISGAVAAYDYFKEWQDVEELGIKPFKVIAQHHVHRMGVTYRPNKKLFEVGCMAGIPEYTKTSSKYTRPQDNGYLVVVQQDGKSILNECREVYIN